MSYKVVPGPTTELSADKKDNAALSAAKQFETIINKNAVDGWRYHSMEVITTHKSEGCFFNKMDIATTFYLLIFAKD